MKLKAVYAKFMNQSEISQTLVWGVSMKEVKSEGLWL